MLESLLCQFDNIVVLDLETTGIDPTREEIIALAALRVTQQGTQDVLDLLVQLSPDKALEPVITRLTGITEGDLSGGVGKEEAARRISAMLSGSKTLVVSYNAQFDMQFLYNLLRRHGDPAVLKTIKMLDALTIYRDRKPYPHKLSDAVAAYALAGQNTHRAIDDARTTLELLGRMGEERDDLNRYINLFGYNAKYGISGKRISSVRYEPQPYQPGAPLYDRQATAIG